MDLLELARRLKPIILDWLSQAVVAVEPGLHALNPGDGPHIAPYLDLAYIAQSGANVGEAPVWDGAAWTPTDVVTQAELDAPTARGSILRSDAALVWKEYAFPGQAYHLQTDATDPTWALNLTMAEDAWIGLGAAAGRLAFDSTPSPDQVALTAADLYVATTAHGIVHVDGNTAGYVLLADGTRYVPASAASNVPVAPSGRGSILRSDATPAWTDYAFPGQAYHLQTDATDPTWAQNLTMAEDAWIGLGAAAGRLAFDSTPSPDQVTLTAADLYVATTAHGIIHVDGNTAGYVLRADGTRFVPGQVSVADISDLAYATPALTFGTANAAGAANSVIRSDATLALFDVTVPTTITVGDTAATGSAGVAARRDHVHGITTSSNPGPLQQILASDGSGHLQLVGLGVGASPATYSVRLPDGGQVGLSEANIEFDTNFGASSWDAVLFNSTGGNPVFGVFEDSGNAVARVDPGNNYADDYLYVGSSYLHCTSTGNDDLTIYTADSGDIILDPDADLRILGTGVSAKVFVNDDANSFVTIGLTINQGTSADEILAFKSSDVDHGMTTLAETDTFGKFSKAQDTSGGLHIEGLKDADGANAWALSLVGTLGEAADTTKSTAGAGVTNLLARIKSGTGKTAVGTDGNLIAIRNDTNTRFIFDAEGEMHSDDVIGAGDDWDEWDDLALAADLSRLPRAKWDEMMRYRAEDFERAGLLTLSVDEDGVRHAFIRHKAMLQFYACCFREVGARLQRYERALLDLGVDPVALMGR